METTWDQDDEGELASMAGKAEMEMGLKRTMSSRMMNSKPSKPKMMLSRPSLRSGTAGMHLQSCRGGEAAARTSPMVSISVSPFSTPVEPSTGPIRATRARVHPLPSSSQRCGCWCDATAQLVHVDVCSGLLALQAISFWTWGKGPWAFAVAVECESAGFARG